MVAGTSVEHVHVHVGPRARCEPFEEVVYELGLQVANLWRFHLQVHNRVRTTAEIDSGDGERLIHRHHEIARTIDAFPVAQRLQERLAERDTDIFDRVVLVDVEIALGLQREIEAAVAREQLQHVIEEADAGADVVASLAVNGQPSLDLGLSCPPIERRAALHRACLVAITDSSASMAALVCSRMPVVIRTHPGVAGSFERSRTWILRADSASMNGVTSPTRTRT